MKLVTYQRDQETSCGIVTDRGIVDIPTSWKKTNPPRSIKEVLNRGPACLDELRPIARAAAQATPLDRVKLLAPIPRPGKVLGLAGNYSEHIKEASLMRGFQVGLSDAPRQTTTPRPFLMPSTCVVGPDVTVEWPVYSEQIDYELELGVVIGKNAKCVAAQDAPDYIAGYCIANDVSARSVTFKKGRQQRPWDEFYDWLNGKWADGFCPMGPWLVTKDEVADVQNLKMVLKVNGEIRQNANTGQMIYSVADIVSFLSHLMTLEPGDVICTGTASGVGMATGNFLKAGDRIECNIEGLGTLTNTLGPRPERFYAPLA
ncbi:MAG: fumarylacetoacetate hydrolase family protein [Phycisphaerales bacterium]|jgi:2-keto-4-pentenoate hydratase/2-oxohepta-3-ene-1,7-dioic acid hydratase in catechol pathway